MDRPGKPPSNKQNKGEQAPGDLGRALKTVYDETLREDVPADFLDLLDKLG
ncbi:NepR family anti-sigma factor [uncultured Sphingomonas sp.]|uniref:NepR family anti-sigma factor n=1 Tax=uncultured Sphingomonas sp. TaxID=158754 RepID=UPI0025DA6956|nr:NepR family anti-sigma factor [uncultured Sphingomonas sp.]